MTKPNFIKTLHETLGHTTIFTKLQSDRTGNEYEAEVIPSLKVLSTGSMEETADGKFKYSIVDPINQLEYSIKVSNQVTVKFGTPLEFKVVRGGPTNAGGWFAAESVEVVKNEKA